LLHAGVFDGVEHSVGEGVVTVRVRRRSQLSQYRSGHHGVLVVPEQFLKLLGLLVEALGRLVDQWGDDFGHVAHLLARFACFVQGGITIGSRG